MVNEAGCWFGQVQRSLQNYTMLKWLSGGGGGGAGNGNGLDNLTHVGKVFCVNEYQVVVEELIAEGEGL